jgi:uncharacterized protein (DUF342 family)
MGEDLDVIPVDFNAKATVSVSGDRMEAKATLIPAGEGGAPLDESMCKHVFKAQGVTFGIDQQALEEAIKKVNQEKRPVYDLVVAKGQAPVNGVDGRVEYLFNAEGKLVPKVREDGSMDFKEVSIIETVAENQELARLHPPTQGRPGRDVCGNELVANNGRPETLPVGANTGAHPNNPNVLIALKGGNVRLNRNVVEVSEGYLVDSDVDFSTGNVKYKGSVFIKKDIKSGFSAEVGGDLEVGGIIEDCDVKSGGSILVKGGVIGHGKGQLVADGSVNVGFIRNQIIKARGNVVVANKAINATILSLNNVNLMGKTLSVAGGRIMARHEIEGVVFGNAQGSRTELAVGVDFTLIEQKMKSDEDMKKLLENKRKVEENIKKFENLKKIKKALPSKQEFLYRKLTALSVELKNQQATLEKRLENINTGIKEVGRARIVIKNKMLPGTTIKIGDCKLAVDQEVTGPTSAVLVKGEIRFI